MRIVLQRVSEASVKVGDQIVGRIRQGYLVLLGIEEADSNVDIEWLINKITKLRLFSDDNGKMNHSIIDIGGEILLISQFTLYASTHKGNRPSYMRAAKPKYALPLYELFYKELKTESGLHVDKGVFGADMKVSLINDGPVTITLDSKNK